MGLDTQKALLLKDKIEKCKRKCKIVTVEQFQRDVMFLKILQIFVCHLPGPYKNGAILPKSSLKFL